MSRETDELYSNIECLRQNLVALIERAIPHFVKGYNSQPTYLVEQGWMQLNGIIVPKSVISHRVLFDHFEANILQSYLILHKEFVTAIDSPLTGFAARTIIDLAYTVIPAILSGDQILSSRLRIRYKIMLTLKDYLAISRKRGDTYRTYYEKLKADKDIIGYLNQRDMKELEFAENDIESMSPLANYVEHYIKRDVQRKLKALGEVTPKQKQFRGKLYSYYSELLHASSAIVLKTELEQTSVVRRELLLMDSALAIAMVLVKHDAIKDEDDFVALVATTFAKAEGHYKTLDRLWKYRG